MTRLAQQPDHFPPSLDAAPPQLRAARKAAAAAYAFGSGPHHAILCGFWDAGEKVRQHLRGGE